ncbi:hypothetical protein jhhlp_000268 [Lomentospora prolificans]|uniref:Long-chain-alcohol oxidase n=1 Tax=Lomentospora prolificans TaxID=41688 RepID=A0A2N3NKF2_9PEZI|nr:hypothetical protein jhhlp_000268 [Lomentospora prolificans]
MAETVEPKSPPPKLSALPPTDYFTQTQWAILFALLDASLPSLATKSSIKDRKTQVELPDATFDKAYARVKEVCVDVPSEDVFRELLADRCSTDPEFIDNCKRFISGFPVDHKKALGDALHKLSTRVGAWFLTGYCTPYHQLPVHVQEKIILSWRQSWIPQLRVLAKTVQQMAQKAYFQTNPLFKKLSTYDDVPRNYEPGAAFDFRFLQFAAGSAAETIETDVVIVGSGPGGSVCARTLAEAGYAVHVVDKGYYFPPSQLPMPQPEACEHLFEQQGVVTSEDKSASLVMGTCWGGSGTINWSVSLQTQQYVREEWATKDGLPFFTSDRFQECLDRVCGAMGVSGDQCRHNHGNRVLLESAEKLGWEAKVAPQNTGGKEHYCGQCHLGCGSNEKMGPVVSYLPAAARAGAKFIEGFEVERVVFEDEETREKAVGVVGRWVSRDANGSVEGPLEERVTRRVMIKAKKVIVSSGSLWSPVILKKSGLENPNIGKNLHIHPCNFLAASFKEDVKPWEGGIITSYCTQFENLDNQGHGTKLEPTCMVPYAALASFPFASPLDAKLASLKYRHMNSFISLTRDRDSGYVTVDECTGRPRVHYTPSAFDAAHTLEGVVGLAKLCYVAGAVEIYAFVPWLEPFVRTTFPAAGGDGDGDGKGGQLSATELMDRDEEFAAWLGKVRELGNRPPLGVWTSAHQMGTCRMSSREDEGVVDPRGRVWGCEGLYVADASTFPSASGVNPMVTNMAIADYIAGNVVEDLKG